jgi:uncharacterized phage infection (PIP) family protein YhgE
MKNNSLDKLLLLVLLGILGYLVYFNFIYNSCEHILTFQVSKVDSQFGLSKTEAIKYATDAANLWNNGLHKQVLKYDDNGDVKITFLYDERQRKTIQTNILKEKAESQKQILDQKSSEIEIQQSNFEDMKEKYESDVATFESKLQNYNNTVQQINANGGATEEEAMALDQEKRQLKQTADRLNERREEINNYLQSVNSSVKSYNNIVQDVNSVVEKINQNNQGEFEEGSYSNKQITLYEYQDVTTLKRLMAHELGHALGLDHTPDPNSIMYYINEGDKFVLTPDDISEYNKVCKNK